VIQPTSTPSADPASLAPGIAVVATAKATLELQKTTGCASAHLGQLLPLYNGPEEARHDLETTASSPVAAREGMSKRELFSNIPLSDGQCQLAWTEHCAYELDGQAWRPSATALLGIWKAFLGAATSEGIDVGSAFHEDYLWTLMADEGYPRPLLTAVLDRLCAEGNAREAGCMFPCCRKTSP
jgi:hypothetical protein